MRFLLLTFLSVLVVSCGDKGSSSSKPGPQEDTDGTGTRTRTNPELYSNSVRETDLLDVATDVPVEISGSRITFKKAVNNAVQGTHIKCELNVGMGETYSYSFSGADLEILTAAGEKRTFKRRSGQEGSIVGSWYGVIETPGKTVQRIMTFVSESQVIMRNHCES